MTACCDLARAVKAAGFVLLRELMLVPFVTKNIGRLKRQILQKMRSIHLQYFGFTSKNKGTSDFHFCLQ